MSDELRQVLEGRGLEGLKKTMKTLSDRREYLPDKSQRCILRQFARLPKNRTKLIYRILTDFFEKVVQKMMENQCKKCCNLAANKLITIRR